MKKIGIILLSYVFILAACSDRQPNGGLPDFGIAKKDGGADAIVPKKDGPPPPPKDGPPPPPFDGPPPPPKDGPPPPPPDGPPPPPPDGPPPPPSDGPVKPPDLPPIPTDGPVKPPDMPVIPSDGPVILKDGPVITPDKALPPDKGTPTNSTCANAETLTWGGSKKISTKGTTSGKTNEYGTGINCGNYSTTFPGNQAYYKLALKANQSYRFTLTSGNNYGHLMIFKTCGVSNINASCGSSGKTGAVSGAIHNNQTGSVMFKPTSGGTYYVAVDGRYPQYNGSFSLTIEEFTPPTNDVCSKATKLSLVKGTVTTTGSTTGAKNEYGTGIGCNQGSIGLDAPQLYYKVSMTAGTLYDIYLKPSYTYAGIYAFRASSCGSATKINSDCAGGTAGNGANDIYVGTNGETLKFRPKTSGDYIIGVDGRRPQDHGSFTLTVTEFKQATNTTCKSASTLKLTGGKVSVKGNTTGATNEFGTQIRCGLSSFYAMDGPQLYYKLFMSGAKQYRIKFSPLFYGRIYIYRNSCIPAFINTDCGSSGKTGAVSSYVYTNQTGQILFKPPAGGTFHIAVDSHATQYAGAFTLEIEEYTPPVNGTCSKATKLSPTSGKITVKGDTTGMANEFGTQINCGSTSSSYIFDGNQQYYTIGLTAGDSYKFTLSPTFYAGMYIFGSSCSPSAINSACGSNGKTGAVTHYVYNNQTRSIIFKAPTTGIYHVAVDSYNNFSTYRGTFTLEIEKWVPAKNSTCKGATKVTLSSGTTTIKGDTTGMANEYGTSIYCGNLNTIYKAEQAYYKMSLTAGTTYTFTMTPQFSYAKFYIFTLLGGVCGINPINNTCGSNGSYGAVSGTSYNNNPVTVSFTPKVSREYYVAVDSIYVGRFGPFTLTVK